MNFDVQLGNVETKAKELKDAFLEIQQPRTNFALKHFVVGEYETPERQYMQVVEELRRAYHMIKISLLEKKKYNIEIEKLKLSDSETDHIDAEIKELHLEELDACIVGKLREFDCLYAIFKSFPKFTHEELEAGEENYWPIRLSRQASEDMACHGRIGVGNLEAMRQIGMITAPTLQIAEVEEEIDGQKMKLNKIVETFQFNPEELQKRDFSKCVGVPEIKKIEGDKL